MTPSPFRTAAAAAAWRQPRDRRRASPAIRPEAHEGQRPGNYGKTLPGEVYSRQEIDALFAAVNKRRKAGVRQAAHFGTLYRCGLRVSESLDLRPKDVDLERRVLRVMAGKGDKPGDPKNRMVGIDDGLAELLEDWLSLRRRLDLSDSAPLFCTVNEPAPGQRQHYVAVRLSLVTLANRAGLEKRFHLHGFRHSHAFELRMEGWDLVEIQHQLGHTRLDTTTTYINHLAPRRRLKVARARAWEDPPETAEITSAELAEVLTFIRDLKRESAQEERHEILAA